MITNKYILLLPLTMMAIACQDTKEPSPESKPIPGEEIQFGCSLDGTPISRTIYGTEDEVNNCFPIYWLNDDQMLIASPQALPGHTDAVYKVDPEQISQHKEYANGLLRVGETGVQWGSSSIAHDFYSIQPYRTANPVTLHKDFSATSPKFTLNMPQIQTCMVSDDADGNPYMTTADMYGCFMYAKTLGVTTNEDVNLTYEPLSTAIRFTLVGPANNSCTISEINLYAPEGVALSGRFNVDLSGSTPTIEPVETSNKLTILARYNNASQNYLILNGGQSIELNAFIIPQATNTKTNQPVQIGDGWYIEVVLAGHQPLKKSLKPKANTGAITTLVPHKIHRLPTLPAVQLGDYDPSTWMQYIPRNVYLTEISIPGSWNSLNKDFQIMGTSGTPEAIAEAAIKAQYAKGCRAFNLDVRYRRNSWSQTENFDLGIANGGESANMGLIGRKVMKENTCPLFSEALGYITSQVQPKEFMVVICNLAQNSYEEDGADWRVKISQACANNEDVYDASNLNANTVIGDLLGKVLVIINSDDTDIPSVTGSKCLFVQAPLTINKSNYQSKSYFEDYLYRASKSSSGVKLLNTQAQITATGSGFSTLYRGYAPTLTERKTKAGNILSWSQTNYRTDNNKHNYWFFLGLGGYYQSSRNADAEGYAKIASELNAWIYDKVNNMKVNPQGSTQTRFYPVGINLMNFITEEKRTESGTEYNVNGPNTANIILQLNNKYHKQFDPSKPAWLPIDQSNQTDLNTSEPPKYDQGPDVI